MSVQEEGYARYLEERDQRFHDEAEAGMGPEPVEEPEDLVTWQEFESGARVTLTRDVDSALYLTVHPKDGVPIHVELDEHVNELASVVLRRVDELTTAEYLRPEFVRGGLCARVELARSILRPVLERGPAPEPDGEPF